MAQAFEQGITKLHEAQGQEREARHFESSLSPQREKGHRTYLLSGSAPQTSTTTTAPEIAFRVAAFANGMPNLGVSVTVSTAPG
jgi:hypothetical protein